jgi:hypothetical protein
LEGITGLKAHCHRKRTLGGIAGKSAYSHRAIALLRLTCASPYIYIL